MLAFLSPRSPSVVEEALTGVAADSMAEAVFVAVGGFTAGLEAFMEAADLRAAGALLMAVAFVAEPRREWVARTAEPEDMAGTRLVRMAILASAEECVPVPTA